MKRTYRWLKPLFQTAVASLVIVVLALGGLQMNEKLSVEQWEIEADLQIKAQIEKYLTDKTSLDFWHTRASVIQEELTVQIPDIKTLEVSRILPNGLHVKAVSRIPLALWENIAVQKQVMLIDQDAYAYRTLKHGENLDLPILRLSKDQLQLATGMLHQMYQQDTQKVYSLSEVVVAEQQWRFNFAYGEQWQLNQVSLEQDMKKVIQVLAKPRWSRGYWRMDARIPQRWFIRPAKQEVI